MRSTVLRDRARRLRKEMTDAERALWARLRKRQWNGCAFRRQHPLGRYIVDFVCLAQRLVIELDGGQHTEHQEYDERRTAWLEKEGYRVVRFWDNEVLMETDAVVAAIDEALRAAPRRQ